MFSATSSPVNEKPVNEPYSHNIWQIICSLPWRLSRSQMWLEVHPIVFMLCPAFHIRCKSIISKSIEKIPSLQTVLLSSFLLYEIEKKRFSVPKLWWKSLKFNQKMILIKFWANSGFFCLFRYLFCCYRKRREKDGLCAITISWTEAVYTYDHGIYDD